MTLARAIHKKKEKRNDVKPVHISKANPLIYYNLV